MAWIGQGIAFAGLAIAGAWVEVSGANAMGIWMVLIFWVVVTDWHPKQ